VFSKTIANLALLGFTDNNRDINRWDNVSVNQLKWIEMNGCN
jgi:hypothetical protein